jgi:hypothetical protein
MKRLPILIVAFALLFITICGPVPNAHAAGNTQYFLGNTTEGSCSGICKNLATSSGGGDTTTTQSMTPSAAPARDANSASQQSGTWTTGLTFSVTGLSTTTTTDVIFIHVVLAPTTVTVSSLSTSGITWQTSARKATTDCTVHMETWWGSTTSALTTQTTTITLSGTPTAASGIITAFASGDTSNPFDSNAGVPINTASGACNTASAPTSGTFSTTNANDMLICAHGSGTTITETAGAIGGTTATLGLTVSGASQSNSMEWRAVSAAQSSITGAFGTVVKNWGIDCDALVGAQKFFIVRPFVTGSTTTGTEGTTPQGNAWETATDLSSGQSGNGLQIISGTWTFQLTHTAGAATAGTAFLQEQVFSCTTISLGTCTRLFQNLDTATNLLGTTSTTTTIYTSATVGAFNNVNFLVIEFWVDFRDLSATTAITMTETTVASGSGGGATITPSSFNDFYNPTGTITLVASNSNVATKNANGQTITITGRATTAIFAASTTFVSKFQYDAVIAGKAEEIGTYVVGQATAFTIKAASSLTLAMTVLAKAPIKEFLAGAITFTMSSLVTATQNSNGQVITINNRATTANFASSITTTSALTRQLTILRSLTGTVTLSGSLTRLVSYLRTFPGSITLNAVRTSGFVKSLTGSITITSTLSRQLTILRSLTGSVTTVSALSRQLTILRSLTGSVTIVSALSRQLTILRSLTGSVTISSSLTRIVGYLRTFTGSITIVSAVSAIRGGGGQAFFENLSGSITITAVRISGFVKSLSGSTIMSSLGQWSTTFPSAGNTVGVITTCYQKPHTPTCFIFIDPFFTFKATPQVFLQCNLNNNVCNPNFGRAALGIALIAIGLIVFFIYRQGGFSMRGNNGGRYRRR